MSSTRRTTAVRGTSSKASKKREDVFVDPNGQVKPPLFFLMAAVPLLMTGRWILGVTAIIACLVFALCNAAMNEMIAEEDKQEIRYNVMDADDVLFEMVEWERQLNDQRKLQKEGKKPSTAEQAEMDYRSKLVISAGLTALAKKYGKEQFLQQQHQQRPRIEPSSTERNSSLPLSCQQASYISLRLFPDDDAVVSAAISLLALVAKDARVRQRHLQEADIYGLDLPIKCLHKSLERAKKFEESKDPPLASPRTDRETVPNTLSKEQQAAELQRKGCLLLGALSDGDTDMAGLVVQEGGLDAILEAASWYRYHTDVANWALWAMFILCYENMANKSVLVRGGIGDNLPASGGVPIVIQTMIHNSDSLEVARHGTAVLFDLMRESDDDTSGIKLDVWKIRNAALASGLHKAVLDMMNNFSDAMDIMMMGQEILTGTGYVGNIPQFIPTGEKERISD